MAVERVRDGEPASEVIADYGFNRTTIYKWLKAALQPGVRIKALRSTKATGCPRSLPGAGGVGLYSGHCLLGARVAPVCRSFPPQALLGPRPPAAGTARSRQRQPLSVSALAAL